jgi:hypothetical protein
MSGILMLSFLSVIPAPMSAQGSAAPKSPKEVLQAYRRMDAEGERLTTSGWYRASRFFVMPGRLPQHRVVAVMDGENIGGTKVDGNRARVWERWSAVGQIDPSGRFTFVVAPDLIDPSGRLLRHLGTQQIHGPHAAMGCVYDLVLADTHWEFGPGREGLREVKGPPEWRIATLGAFDVEPRVTIEVAIRYLTRLRDESSSEIIKRNADKSIATLRRLLKE